MEQQSLWRFKFSHYNFFFEIFIYIGITTSHTLKLDHVYIGRRAQMSNSKSFKHELVIENFCAAKCMLLINQIPCNQWLDSRIKIDWNSKLVGLLHHPFWLQLVSALSDHYFELFSLLCLAKDHLWGVITRNAHMIHIVYWIRFKIV